MGTDAFTIFKTLKGANNMQEMIGNNFDATLTTVQVASKVRQWIKGLIETELPKAKYSVRSQYFAGGSSITVIIKDFPRNIHTIKDGQIIFTDEAIGTKKKIYEMLSSFNLVRQDIQSDYYSCKFFQTVEFDSHEESDDYRMRVMEMTAAKLPEAIQEKS